MSRARWSLLIVAVAIVASSCSNELGRAVPGCVDDLEASFAITSGIFIEMQAVESAEFVPCISLLPQGWDYEHVVPKRGEARFWISSDRVGHRFLEVTLRDACDVGDAIATGSGADGVQRYRDTTLVPDSVLITIVPVSGRELEYAAILEAAIEEGDLHDRKPFVVTDRQDAPLEERIAAARAEGMPVIVIDEQDLISRTASLQLPGESRLRRGLEFGDVVERLDHLLPKPRLTGTWFDVFEGGCVQYEFDASGSGVDSLEEDVDRAIGLFPAGELRVILTDQGVLG